jgi:3-oxoacyl-[acyl-carrier protein] reductase
VADLDGPKADGVVADITAAGGRAASFAGDVTAPEFARACIAAALAAFGGDSIDILVNNAGAPGGRAGARGAGKTGAGSTPAPPKNHPAPPPPAPPGYTWDGVSPKLAQPQWDARLAVHCTAPLRLVQAAAPHMRGAAQREEAAGKVPRPRSIINVSSTSGTHGNAGQANYATAKAGVVGLTKTIAREWGGLNVRANALAYGFIATRLTGEKGDATIEVGGKKVALGIPGGSAAADAAAEMMIPMRRVGTPEEAAGAMLALASPYCGFVSGQCLEVTGGAFI